MRLGEELGSLVMPCLVLADFSFQWFELKFKICMSNTALGKKGPRILPSWSGIRGMGSGTVTKTVALARWGPKLSSHSLLCLCVVCLVLLCSVLFCFVLSCFVKRSCSIKLSYVLPFCCAWAGGCVARGGDTANRHWSVGSVAMATRCKAYPEQLNCLQHWIDSLTRRWLRWGRCLRHRSSQPTMFDGFLHHDPSFHAWEFMRLLLRLCDAGGPLFSTSQISVPPWQFDDWKSWWHVLYQIIKIPAKAWVTRGRVCGGHGQFFRHLPLHLQRCDVEGKPGPARNERHLRLQTDSWTDAGQHFAGQPVGMFCR